MGKVVKNRESANGDGISARQALVMPQEILSGISGIERAIVQQTKWFKDWHEKVVCNYDTGAVRVDSVQDIPLGAWFKSDGAEAFRNNPGFLQLGEKLEEVVTQVKVFLRGGVDGQPQPVENYALFMNTLMDLNTQVHQLQNDAWRGLTRMDPLTGVRNRHDMMIDLDAERERARRTAVPCSVAMADLDHFKALNDTHGHIVGDQVLRKVSSMLAEYLRPYDLVYRYGGEEFLLCLPNTHVQMAAQVLERLRVKIAETPFPFAAEGGDLTVTASFGVVEIDTRDHVIKSIERADMALYEAKQTGRNMVHTWLKESDLAL